MTGLIGCQYPGELHDRERWAVTYGTDSQLILCGIHAHLDGLHPQLIAAGILTGAGA
jgi:hypothetical protein